MRRLVIFLTGFAVIGLISFSLIARNLSGKGGNNAEINAPKRELLPHEFSTFTSAVCESKEDAVHCKDEIFINCSGKILKAGDVAECNGVRLDTSQVSGFAVFGKDWKDPRI